MTIERVTRHQFEESLREDEIALDEAARLKAIEEQKRREREQWLMEMEEARNNFGGPA
ncbi:hypothetical protein ACJO2E_08735 [Marinobacter sp. M1N3S26]|uniref:hypothetical protein n=1 Tax=Marinobacter sp. M1N3S26 TaxID=3382299 RepID=UPI00387A88A8